MKGPLSNIRVLAVENALAGPFGTMTMGDLGAEVIKIEAPIEGDKGRRHPPYWKRESFYYLSHNRNKKSVIMDLTTPSGKDVFYRLVEISDVVWTNFRPDVLRRLAIDFEPLSRKNPRIITCNISGFGFTGPYKDKSAYDIIVQAMSGIMGITGEPSRPPVRCAPPIGDIGPSLYGLIGVLAALNERNLTGKGKNIDVAMLDSCIAFIGYFFSHYFITGQVPEPQGSGHLGAGLYHAFKTKDDRYIVLAAGWPRLARTIGAEWLIDDPRFQTVEDRSLERHGKELTQIIAEYISKETAEQWLALFEVDDIPSALIETIDEVVQDPQVLNRNMILSLPHPLGGDVKVVGNPIKMKGLCEDDYTAPPVLGQHTDMILKELLGFSDDEVRRYKEDQEAHYETLKPHLHKTIEEWVHQGLKREES